MSANENEFEALKPDCRGSCQEYLEQHVHPYIKKIEEENKQLLSTLKELRAQNGNLRRENSALLTECEENTQLESKTSASTSSRSEDRQYRRLQNDILELQLDRDDARDRAQSSADSLAESQRTTLAAIQS